MKKGYFQILVLLLGFSTISCSQPAYEISEENVTRIISTLASDEMKGRATFTPEIDLAADFISSEFKSIGLDPIDEADGYFQAFNMYSIASEDLKVQINGVQIESGNTFISADSEVVKIDDLANVRYIKSGENFRAKFSEYQGEAEDILIVVDSSFKELFGRYARFMGRPSNKFETGTSSNKVFAIFSGVIESVDVVGKNEITSRPLKNVAGMIPGNRKNEFVLFSAHYDHIGIRPAVEGDSIANGANDDASGTTAVVELARYYKSLGTPERTLLFVAFTAEESGGFGSRHFSRQLDPDQIIAMFNIEMIGKPAVEGPNTAWITGFDKSSFGELLQKSAEGSIYTFYPDPYPDQNLFYRSDNATLARLGVPAHSISTTPIDVDKDYHQISDEVETLNLEHLTNTIKAIASGSKGMVNGTLTPTRVDPESID